MIFNSPVDMIQELENQDYILDESKGTTLFLVIALENLEFLLARPQLKDI